MASWYDVIGARTVCFDKLANAFDHTAAPAASFRLIQRFIAGFALDGDWTTKAVEGFHRQVRKVTKTEFRLHSQSF